jgi:hypothetical protein
VTGSSSGVFGGMGGGPCKVPLGANWVRRRMMQEFENVIQLCRLSGAPLASVR